jgi:hypothetical protein
MSSDYQLKKRRLRTPRPCPSGHPDHQVLQLKHSVLAPLGLPRGSLLHVDRSRKPHNGDLVWAELVLAQDRVRMVRRYEERDGSVKLTAPGSGERAITYPRHEVLVLGVAEPASVASCRPDPPETGTVLPGHGGDLWVG